MSGQRTYGYRIIQYFLNVDIVRDIGIIPEKDDLLDTIRGLGGVEYVYTKIVDSITIGAAVTQNFQVEIGDMDYGLEIQGLLGFNLLKRIEAKIDVDAMEIIVD